MPSSDVLSVVLVVLIAILVAIIFGHRVSASVSVTVGPTRVDAAIATCPTKATRTRKRPCKRKRKR